MTIAGPATVFGMRYCTYIWLTVMVPGAGALDADVPGWLGVVVGPLTKKRPSSASCSLLASDPAIASPPVADSRTHATAALHKLRFMLVMAASLSRRLLFMRTLRARSGGR